MLSMVVTLDVLKLSGWLKTIARCRVAMARAGRRVEAGLAHAAGTGEVRAGRRRELLAGARAGVG